MDLKVETVERREGAMGAVIIEGEQKEACRTPPCVRPVREEE